MKFLKMEALKIDGSDRTCSMQSWMKYSKLKMRENGECVSVVTFGLILISLKVCLWVQAFLF